jgi:hypothetical protein
MGSDFDSGDGTLNSCVLMLDSSCLRIPNSLRLRTTLISEFRERLFLKMNSPGKPTDQIGRLDSFLLVIIFQRSDWNNPMRTPIHHETGLIAILDALGAASYSDAEIQKFLDSRALVLQLLNAKAESILGELTDRVSTFTFNDTIVILLKAHDEPSVRDVTAFFTLLRKFLIETLVNRILFRGAISLGTFYASDETNTVMGQAVTDAAAWYNLADWIGIHATPRATVLIDHLLESEDDKRTEVVVDYQIPLKNKSKPTLKAVNWPKGYFVKGVSPCEPEQSRRANLLELLGRHPIPVGVEDKYFHAIAFFDWIVKSQKLSEKFGKRHHVRSKTTKTTFRL